MTPTEVADAIPIELDWCELNQFGTTFECGIGLECRVCRARKLYAALLRERDETREAVRVCGRAGCPTARETCEKWDGEALAKPGETT